MFYNLSKQEELEHSFLASMNHKDLVFNELDLGIESHESSIFIGKNLDKELTKILLDEAISNRMKINPIKYIQQEKSNSEVLLLSPELNSLDPEESKKLLDIKENYPFSFEKFGNFYLNTNIDLVSWFSEYLHKFCLTNMKSHLNEEGSIEEIEKNLNELKHKLETSETVMGNFFKLIPIMDEFTGLQLENVDLKYKYLEEIKLNISSIMGDSNELLIKVNSVLKTIFNNFKFLIDEFSDKFNVKTNEEHKNKLIKLLKLIFNISYCFKFSYGFFFLTKYIDSFELENEFNEPIDLYELNKIPENIFSDETKFMKKSNSSDINPPFKTIFKFKENLKNLNEIYPYELFSIDKDSSLAKLGNTVFLYNDVFGLIKFDYFESENMLKFSDINTKAFDLKKGTIHSIGSEDSGFIIFLSKDYFLNQENPVNFEDEDKEGKSEEQLKLEKIEMLLSKNINLSSENLNIYRKNFHVLFSNLKDWLVDSFTDRYPDNKTYFVYTDKEILIPKDHLLNKMQTQEMLKNVKIYINNGCIHCLRPINSVKNDKKIQKIYFSEKYIYVVDTFRIGEEKNSKFEINHLNSVILTNKSISGKALNFESPNLKYLENLLDSFSPNNLNSSFIHSGKLTIMNNSMNFFIYDLFFDSFEIVNKLAIGEDGNIANENLFYFMTKNDCFVILSEKNSESSDKKFAWRSKFETICRETSLSGDHNGLYDSIFFEILNNQNYKACHLNKLENSQINKFINARFQCSNISNIRSNEDKIENISENANERNNNFLVNLLGNLALSANNKINNRSSASFEKIFMEKFIAYNDSDNFSILFELIMRYFEKNVQNQSENSLRILFSLLIIFKLHVRNNKKLKLEFSTYLYSSEILFENIKKLFDYLANLLNTYDDSKDNSLLGNVISLSFDSLFEIIPFIFKEKESVNSILIDFISKTQMIQFKILNFVEKHQENDEKSTFLLNLQYYLLKSLHNLFDINSNYIISFILNEKLGSFILGNFQDLIKVKEYFAKNCNYGGVIFQNSSSNSNYLNRINSDFNLLNLENYSIKILNLLVVKILNCNINFCKKRYNSTFEKILENISPNLKNEDKNELSKKIISFFITLTLRILESTNNYLDLMILYPSLSQISLNREYAFNCLNLILNYSNILNFEIFPDLVFSCWHLVLNLLNKMTVHKSYSLDEESKISYEKKLNSLLAGKQKSDFLKYREKINAVHFNHLERKDLENIKKLDIVINNNMIDDMNQNNPTEINVDPEYFYLDKKSIGEELYDLYIEIHSLNHNEEINEKLIEISETKNKIKEVIFSHSIEKGGRVEFIILKDISIKSGLSIKIFNINTFVNGDENSGNENNLKHILYKMRISNYKIFDRITNNLLNTTTHFINKSIKYLISYENANLLNNLKVNEDVKELVSSNLFSGGVSDCKSIIAKNVKLISINKDLKNFFGSLDQINKEKFEFLNNQNEELEKFNPWELKNSSRELSSKIEVQSYHISDFFNEVKSYKIKFEELICLKEYDYTEYENKKYLELNPEKKGYYLLRKLFAVFDFLIEKVNREYIVKGELIDKIILGIFFVCFHQENFFENLQNTINYLFANEENYQKYTNNTLVKEEVVKLLENSEFEKSFFVWKNICAIRKIFKNKKDAIFQQMDENFRDGQKINLDFDKSEIELVKIECLIDPNQREDEVILKYFERYLEKIKLIYILKSYENTKKKPELRKSYLKDKTTKPLLKRKSSQLKNFMRKAILDEDRNTSDNKENKIKKKLKDIIKNTISAISNDTINPDNILACIQSLSVKIKFREISLLIINIILKNFKQNDVKGNLLSNFYFNFKQGNNLPNVLDNLNISSTEQSEIITNLFHEYLFHLFEEVNSTFVLNENFPIESNETKSSPKQYFKNNQGNSLFYLTIVLNNFLWNIKGRNFQFLLDSQFFQNLFNNHKNEFIKLARTGMFFNPRHILYNENDSTTASIICNYDIFHVSELLTDIMKIYSNIIIKRIIKENSNSCQETEKNKEYGLVKSHSILDQLNHHELVMHIFDDYKNLIEFHLDNILFEKKNEIEKKHKNFNLLGYLNNIDSNILCFDKIEENNYIFSKNITFYQKKIWNILISILKLITINDSSIGFIFNNLGIFTKILLLSLFTNEKNTYLIFKIFKILMLNLNKTPENFEFFCIKLKEYYKNIYIPLITSKSVTINQEDLLGNHTPDQIESMENVEFFLKFIISQNYYISKIKNNKDLLIFDKQLFLVSNNVQNHIEVSIEEKIFGFVRYFISLSEFRDNSMKVLNDIILSNKFGGIMISKMLDSSVGCLNNFSRVICNTKLDFSSAQINKIYEQKDLDSMVKKGIIIFDKSIFYLNDKASEEKLIKFNKIQENRTEDNLVISFMEDGSNLVNQIEINSPNLLFPALSELILNDECNGKILSNVDKDIFEKLLNYLEENFVKKNISALIFLQTYIRIFKFIKKITLGLENKTLEENQNIEYNEIKNLVENFFKKNILFFEHFLAFESDNIPANLFSIDKLENLFFSYKPYDVKKLSKNQKENILLFKNPINTEKPIKLFPFGIDSKTQEIIIEEIEETQKSKFTDDLEKFHLYLLVNHEKNYVDIKNENQVVERLIYNNIIRANLKDKDKYDDSIDGKGRKIEIFDKNKAIAILEEHKGLEEKKELENKLKDRAVFLTCEFIEYLNINDTVTDINAYLDKIKDKFEASNEKSEKQDIPKKENADDSKINENQEESKEEKENEKKKDKKEESKQEKETPSNQIIFENFIKNNYSESTLFVISDEYFYSLDKNFSCISLDYQLMEDSLKEFLTSPSKSCNFTDNKYDENTLLKKFGNFLIKTVIDKTGDKSLKKQIIKENEDNRNKINNSIKKIEEIGELKALEKYNKIKCYDSFLKLLELEEINIKSFFDSQINNNKTFEKLLMNIETIPFGNQKETEIKALGFHILKQHLRFLSLYFNKNYFSFETDKNFDENKIGNLLKYLKLLYMQTNFKEKFFNSKLENKFIRDKVLSIIKNVVRSDNKSILNLFNLKNKQMITLKDSISNEFDGFNSDFQFFIEELITNFKLKDINISSKNKSEQVQNNVLMTLKIYSFILETNVETFNHLKIVNLLNMYSEFLDDFLIFFNNNKENHHDDVFRNFVRKVILFFINDESFNIIFLTKSRKYYFSSFMLQFALKIIKIFEISTPLLDLNIRRNFRKFSFNFYKIFKSLDIIDNKIDSPFVIRGLTEKLKCFNDSIKKNFKLPNLKNFFCLILKENKFKSQELNFTNSLKNDNLYLTLGELKFSKNEKSIEYKSKQYVGNSSLLNYKNHLKIEPTQKIKNQFVKNLIFADDINNINIKNLVFISDGNISPKVFELNKNISSIDSLYDGNALIYKLDNKVYLKGKFDKLYTTSTALKLLDDIQKNETIYSIFNMKIIVTNKFIHYLGKLEDMNSSYTVHDNYTKIPIEPIKNPQKIIHAAASNLGIILADSDNNVYYGGCVAFDQSSDYNKLNLLKGFPTNYEIVDVQTIERSSLLLLKEDDGKCYLWGTGVSRYATYVNGRGEYYIKNFKIKALKNKPMKKFMLLPPSLFVGLSEENEIYYSGNFKNSGFGGNIDCYSYIKKWEWPEKNSCEIIDIYNPGGDCIIFDILDKKTEKVEKFAIGQIYMLNKGTPKFINFSEEPFKFEMNKIFDNEEKKEEKKEVTKTEELKVEEILNQQNLLKELEELNFDEEINTNDDDLLTFSRFELNKVSGGQPIEIQTNQDSNEEERNDNYLLEYSNPLTKPLKENYKYNDIKISYSPGIPFKFAYIKGYEIVEKNFNLERLKDLYSLRYCDDVELDEEKTVNGENIEIVDTSLKDNQNKKNTKKNKKEKSQNIKKIKFNQGSIGLILKNKDNILQNYLYDNIPELLYLRINVSDNSDSIIISPKIYSSREKFILSCNLDKDIVSKEEELLLSENKLFKLINMNLNCNQLEFINSNINELFGVLFMCEDIIIYKNLTNINYIDNDDLDNKRENIMIEQIPNDENLHDIMPDLYQKCSKILKEDILKKISISHIKEYRNAKDNYQIVSKSNESNEITFDEYLKKSYGETGSNSVLYDKECRNIMDSMFKIYSTSMIFLYSNVNLQCENQISKLVLNNIGLLEKSFKDKLIENEINQLPMNMDRCTIKVDRLSARRFKLSGQVDKKFEKTIFSQVYREMKKKMRKEYLKDANVNLFRVNLVGEGAIDAGGPGREIYTLIFDDLMSNRHDIFIQTPNQKTKSGLGRDLWTINPSANTIYHLDCFEFIGKVFGYAIVSKNYCPLHLPKFVWKQILNLKLRPEDIEEIDVVAYNSIVKVCLNPEKYKEELDSLFEFATFSACLSNGEEVDLIENGKNVQVNENNYKQFIELYCEARYREIKEQSSAIAKGITFVIPSNVLLLFSANELSERVTGPKTFDMELFKKNTHYSGFTITDNTIVFFWKFIENCTLQEKIQYLKFVWGRTTLPSCDENFTQKHSIEFTGLTTMSLPISHTCFFSIEMPKYTSYNQLKAKLTYAMNNAYIISDRESQIQLDFD